MPLFTDLNADFKKMAAGIESDALKAELTLQLEDYIDAINKVLAASHITLRLRIRTEGEDHHLSYAQFNREVPYAKVKFDVKKEEASITPEGKKAERLTFSEFKKRILRDVFERLDMDERVRFAGGFRTVIAQLDKPKELAGPAVV